MLPKKTAGALRAQCLVLVPFDVDLEFNGREAIGEEAASRRYGALGRVCIGHMLTTTRASHLQSVVVLSEHGTDRAQGQEPTHLVAGLLELVGTRQVTSCNGIGLVGIGADEHARPRARAEAHVAQVDKPAELRVGAERHVDHSSVRGHHLEGIDLIPLGGRHHGVVAEVSSHIGIALWGCSRRWTPRLHGSEVVVLPRSC